MRKIIPGSISTKDLHQFMLGAVSPRPIAFVSTMDENGVANIAPYSFFNAFSSNPPILVFSSNRRVDNNTTKDTLHNILLNKEVVVNVVNYDIVQQMALASISYEREIDEFVKSGLTPIPSDFVKPYRIKESPAHFECRVKEVITLGEHGGAGHLIVCDVLCVHISEEVIDDKNRIDPDKIDLVGRMGRAFYVRASGDAVFDVYQNVMKPALGFDQLPEHITKSAILCGNEIAKLAGLYEIPDETTVKALVQNDTVLQELIDRGMAEKDLHLLVRQAILEGDDQKALKIAMLKEYY